MEATGFNPERLRIAREAAGLTLKELALQVGVSYPSLSLYENTDRVTQPKSDTLDKIALALDLPKLYFLSTHESMGEDKNIRWRSQHSATEIDKKMAVAKYRLFRLTVINYIERFIQLPSPNLPNFHLENVLSLPGETVEKIANKTREYWGLGNGVIPNLSQLLEKNGLIVFFSNLQHKTQDAYSLFSGDQTKVFICISTNKTPARRRFSMAHELGHLILHKEISQEDYLLTKNYKVFERQAHRFSGAFLLPEISFLNDLHIPSLDALAELKPKWKVSVKMMIQRCHDLDIISDNLYTRMLINYNRRGWSRQEPYENLVPVEQPRLLRRCLEGMVEKKIQEPKDIFFHLQLSQKYISELLGIEPEFFSALQKMELVEPQFRPEVQPQKGKIIAMPKRDEIKKESKDDSF